MSEKRNLRATLIYQLKLENSNKLLGEWTNLTGQNSHIVRFWLILKSQFIKKKSIISQLLLIPHSISSE
jgi:hypothetical protein